MAPKVAQVEAVHDAGLAFLQRQHALGLLPESAGGLPSATLAAAQISHTRPTHPSPSRPPAKMAAMKRPASSTAGGSAKRSSRDPIAKKCELVAAAIRDSEGLPENVSAMLSEMVPYSLSVLAAERHPSQSKAVEMVSEAMSAIEEKMKTDVAQAQVKVDSADVEKASRVSAAAAAEANLKDCEAKTIAAREASDIDHAGLKEAKSAVVSAHAEQAKIEKDLVEEADKQATIKAATETFNGMRTSKLAGTEGRKAFMAVSSALAEICAAEASMVSALHETLKKECEARGSFDHLVVEQAATALTKGSAELDQALAAGESTKAAAAAATAAAEAASAVAEEKSAARHAAWDEAAAAWRTAEEALKDAKEAMDNFDKDIGAAASDLDEAVATLAEFIGGPGVAFAELKVLAPPPPKIEEADIPAAEEMQEAPPLEVATASA